MKTVKTITCHDVYNVGASLQAYALAAYLNSHGCDAEILDYKPEYLGRHYRLDVVSNPRFNKPLVKQLYLLAKLPGRLKARKSGRKKEFDAFREQHLPVSRLRFETLEDLRKNCPKADVYIAGSDQIWNPLFQNGKDPVFFLDFVTEGKKVSYAASFAVNELPEEIKPLVAERLKAFDALSVREKSGLVILKEFGLQGEVVLDPVFLLDRRTWQNLLPETNIAAEYLYSYDFGDSEMIAKLAKEIADEKRLEVFSYFKRSYATMDKAGGPLTFLRNLADAEIVLSNSFHATAFSLIFHKEFFVVGRKEAINSRMADLLESIGLRDRFLSSAFEWKEAAPIDWNAVDYRLKQQIKDSEDFLKRALEI